jgi:hypothetical protein
MEQPGDDVFPGTAFARDQHRKIRASHTLQLLPHIAHRWCLPKDHRFGRKLLDRDRAFVVGACQQWHHVSSRHKGISAYQGIAFVAPSSCTSQKNAHFVFNMVYLL